MVEDGSDANVDSPSETEADDVQTSSDEDEGDLPATPVDQPLLTNGDLLGEKMMFWISQKYAFDCLLHE